LIAQKVASLDGIVGMVFPVIAAVGEGRVNPALGCIGMATDRVHLADYRGIGAIGPSRDGRTHPSQSGSDHQDIML
jgi:hypothetical protein